MTFRSVAESITVVDQARGLTRQVSTLVRAPRALRTSARQQAIRLADQLRRQRVAALPVEEVRLGLPRGTRFPAALAEHFGSVAELAAAEVDELRAVPGVGATSAERIQTAARELAGQVGQQVTVRLDGARGEGLTRLVATLAAVRYADSTVPDVADGLRRWPRRALPLLAETGRAVSWWRMVLCAPARRRRARAAVAELAVALAEPDTRDLRRVVRQHLPGVRPQSWTGEQAWAEYERDPQGFEALLACVGGNVCAGHPDAAEGHLPIELRERITSTEVDTSLLTATLMPYQVFGAQYILHQRRTILGDEMGLGKTVQALAGAAHVVARDEAARVLVVCPASVLWNWIGEIGEHTRLRPYLVHGEDRDGAVFRWRKRGGIAVTTFGTLEKLRLPDTAMTIVDEAHYAKNEQARRSRLTEAATRRAKLVTYLTGTPMENKASEFARLVSMLDNGVDVVRLAEQGSSLASNFRNAVGSVYLRRNQADVLHDLPRMIPTVEWVQLTDRDREAYERAPNDDMSRRRATFGEAKRARLARIIAKAQANGRKVLVFSFFRSVLEQIRIDLGELAVGPITGEVSPQNRQRLVDEFTARDGPAVLLGQIGAAGTGLNIQAASVVILAEPQWTSTIEEQAIARSLRRGQTHIVLVYRLVALGTRDMRVRAVALGKGADFEQYARPSVAKESDARAVAV